MVERQYSDRASPSTQRRRRGVGEGRAAPWRVVRLPSPHPSIYRGKGEGGRPPRTHLGGCGGLGERGEGGLPPKSRGAPPLGFPLNPRRMGPREGGAASPPGAGSLPHAARVAPREGWPLPVDPGTLPVAPVQYRYDPETSRCPFDNFPYINLYLRTLPDLLVTSRIPSGTPNNIR